MLFSNATRSVTTPGVELTLRVFEAATLPFVLPPGVTFVQLVSRFKAGVVSELNFFFFFFFV